MVSNSSRPNAQHNRTCGKVAVGCICLRGQHQYHQHTRVWCPSQGFQYGLQRIAKTDPKRLQIWTLKLDPLAVQRREWQINKRRNQMLRNMHLRWHNSRVRNSITLQEPQRREVTRISIDGKPMEKQWRNRRRQEADTMRMHTHLAFLQRRRN